MIEDIISENTLTVIKKEISQKDGAEVFFVGKIETNSGRISSVIPCAWGNDNAVPIVFEEAYKGDYLIHNHPSGDLKPSENDIALSAHFANQGIGFIIINNDATKYYTVVKSVDISDISLLNINDMASFLEPGGLISESLKEYEFRQGQIDMLTGICEAFNDDSVAVLEAGTGTGKSMAYLIPAIFWSVNNKEKIVISTNTINLQEQLIFKDIPFIKKALNIEFKVVLVKGRNNYVCIRKAIQFINDNELFDDGLSEYKQSILKWLENTRLGTKEDLGFFPVSNIWEKIASERDICIKSKCKHFKECYFFKARKEMLSANILVVNHHILCSDISIRKAKGDYTTAALLPAYTKVVIDEAHNIEDSVSSFFGSQVSRFGLKRVFSKVFRKTKKSSTGTLSSLNRKIRGLSIKYPAIKTFENIIKIVHSIMPLFETVAPVIDEFFDSVFIFINNKIKNKFENKLRLIKAAHQDQGYKRLVNQSKEIIGICREIGRALARLHNSFDELSYYYREDIRGEIREVLAYSERLKGYADSISDILNCSKKEFVYWLEVVSRQKKNVYLNMCPIEINDLMIEFLFNPIHSVILTSATLSAGGNFEFLKSRIGLNKLKTKDLYEKILSSHFDYKEQALLCIPEDIVDPNHPQFDKHYCEYAKSILEVTGGATFFLCTSFSQINNLKRYFSEIPQFSNLNILAQGQEDRSTLLKRFKSQDNSVLLGTASFWEGVDVPGDDLKCVVIVKLPFKVPSEPLYQARAEKIEEEGMSSFFNYSLPISIIKFKQGFGRLIRSTYDEGVVVCLDKRIVVKSYGKYFIDSLPDIPIVYSSKEEILDNISKFFR